MKITAPRFAILFFLALALGGLPAAAQSAPNYDGLIQKGKAELQAGNNEQALATGERAIKLDPNRWKAYALAGGALMNLKRYEKAADDFSEALKRAPQDKQPALSNLRKQCLLAAAGVAQPNASPAAAPPETTAQNSGPTYEQNGAMARKCDQACRKPKLVRRLRLRHRRSFQPHGRRMRLLASS